jgi:hypothetical protein
MVKSFELRASGLGIGFAIQCLVLRVYCLELGVWD